MRRRSVWQQLRRCQTSRSQWRLLRRYFRTTAARRQAKLFHWLPVQPNILTDIQWKHLDVQITSHANLLVSRRHEAIKMILNTGGF